MTNKLLPGMPVVWPSTVEGSARLFYGRVVSVHPGLIFGSDYVLVRDRNFKQPIAVRESRVSILSNKNIDTAPRPLLVS